jgi:uncharacterized protein
MKKPVPEVHNERLMPFRWKQLDDRVLLTNDAGEYAWLERDAFGDFLAGTLPDDHPAWLQLQQKNLVRSSEAEKHLMDRIQARNRHLFLGPNLHIVILTLRCNQNCVYCHASRKPLKSKGYDMDLDTARRVVDVVFESPSDELTIEFQGGEPTLNFDVLRFIVEDAQRRNRGGGRALYFSLVSNLSSLTQEQIDFLVDRGVMICTSIDGPAGLHDRNRRFKGHSSHREALKQIQAFDRAYRQRGMDPELAYVNALATVSRSALRQPEAVVDEYVRLGHKVIHLRPLNPFGMGLKVWSREGYSAQEFLDFYLRALDYIIELNRRGTEIMEKMASLMLTRILTQQDPNYMDLRSPCGAGLGQLAYNYDGRVYTCDEGRMVGAMGDHLFCIGDVHQDGYAGIIRHAGVRSLCVASCLECLPGCSDCAYAPYCGVCPVYNYIMEGDLVARSPNNDRCRIQKGMLDHLFRRLAEPGMQDLLFRWTESKDRSSVYSRIVP